MKWTSEMPFCSGWYWHKEAGIKSVVYYHAPYDSSGYSAIVSGLWAGPIPEPED